MNQKSFIGGMLVGLALGLSVAVGVGLHFTRKQKAESHAVPNSSTAMDPIDREPGGAVRTVSGANARAAKFETLDLNKDGVLSITEFAGTRKAAEAEKWFKRRDTNNDGSISREEFLPFSAGSENP